MLHASCLGSCYFLSFRGQHGRGEARGDAGARQRCRAAPAQRSGNPRGSFQRLGTTCSGRLLRFLFLMDGVRGVSHSGQQNWHQQLGFGIHTCSTRGSCAGGTGCSSQVLWCGRSPAQLLLLIPAALLFYFSNTESRERRKTPGTKEHQPFSSLREGFHILLAP